MPTPAFERIIERAQNMNFIKFALPIVAAIILLSAILSGRIGFVEIKPGQAAVIYNAVGWSIFGEDQSVITDQGTVTYFPFVQRISVLDIEPQVLVMEGKGNKNNPNHVNLLTVRANDGSNFYFERMEIHYQAMANSADIIITENGINDGYKRSALAVHSREILRNEFGRYTFLEVAKPSTYGKATALARKSLNDRLNPLGIVVTQIITPKPRFQPKVEQAIEERQTAEQEVQVQEEKRKRLQAQSRRKVQDVEQEKNAEYQSLIARLEGERRAAENEAIATHRKADKYHIDSMAKCQAYRGEKVKLAKANAVAYRKQAEGMAAKIKAVGARGADVLNLEIAKHIFPQLDQITAVPYAEANSPVDLRYVKGQE